MESSYKIQNVSEDMIDMFLEDCLNATDMCRCDRCRADVKAYALNAFPPHYVVTDFGDALTRAMALSNQFQADIITAIMQGVMVVKNSPRCEASGKKDK